MVQWPILPGSSAQRFQPVDDDAQFAAGHELAEGRLAPLLDVDVGDLVGLVGMFARPQRLPKAGGIEMRGA